jgi:hypothetical protein
MFLAGNISAPPTIMPAKADEAPSVSARAISDDLNMGISCLNLLIDQHWQERIVFKRSCRKVKNVFVIEEGIFVNGSQCPSLNQASFFPVTIFS